MSTIHRTGLAIAALVTIAILAGAVVAQGYYAALAQATPEPTPGPAATDTPAPSFTPSPEVPVVYIAAPTSPPTTPPRPAVARVPTTPRPVVTAAPTTRSAATPRPTERETGDE